jgi:hypothetical protein
MNTTTLRNRFSWFGLDLGIVLWVATVEIASLIRFGPLTGPAVGGICINGLESVGCYSAYPTSALLMCAFCFIMSLKDAKIAIPLTAFNVSFGELFFTPDVFGTPNWHPEYFQPITTAMWLAIVFIVPILMRRWKYTLRWTWILPFWFAACWTAQWFIPYSRTSLDQVLVSNVFMSVQCVMIWRMFRR